MTTVLVVDDEWDIRELLVDTILDIGLEVIEAGDGKTALERVAKDQPDLLLLDVWMPGMDGFEVLQKLREDPGAERIPVVLLTAMPASEGEMPGLGLGVTHYVNKPWDPGVIEATIRVALRESGREITQQSEDDGLAVGAGNVDIRTPGARFPNAHGASQLRSGRKKRPTVTNKDGSEMQVITTGEKLTALEQRMGGGCPLAR